MKITFLIVLFFIFNTISYGQLSDYGSSTETHHIVSNDNRKYNLKITLPNNYKKNKAYKTLYYLDSWWLSETILGSYALLHLSSQVEDLIFIGISIDGNIKDWNVQRILDFTPSEYDVELMGHEIRAGHDQASIELAETKTGGASTFIEFLETTAIKYVEKKFNTLKNDRGLIGHSYGGLFGFYAMSKNSQLFSNYILISPSLWWNRSEIIKNSFFGNLKEVENPIKLYLAFGGTESKLIEKPSIEILKIIQGTVKGDFDYQLVIDKEANYSSILPRTIYDGLLYLYGT